MGAPAVPDTGLPDTGGPPVSDVDPFGHPVDLYVMLLYDRRLLFVHNVETGAWVLPSGTLDIGESPTQGVGRIALDQIAVLVAVSSIYLVHVQHHHDGIRRRIGLYF